MAIKILAKQCRDMLQRGIYCVINPFVRLLIKLGFTPNLVTTIGLLGNIAAAVVIVMSALDAKNNGGVPDYSLLTWGGALIIGFSLFDMLDGQVARIGNMASTFGALYDSVLDRYCEMVTLGGIAYYLIQIDMFWGAVITFVAMIGSVMVSYVRARAEGLDIECKIGFMQRPERVVVTAVATLATGICGLSKVTFDPNIILIVAMSVIAVFANMTAFARIAHCSRELQKTKK